MRDLFRIGQGLFGGQANWTAAAVGGATLVAILLLKPYKRIPGLLIAVVGATIAVGVLNLDATAGVSVLGPLPQGLPALALPLISVEHIRDVVIGGFAVATSYPLALALLFVAGFLELAFFSMAQTLVQMHAPNEVRGRVIGLFNMSALGLRAFSGVTVGLGGSLIGIHLSLALSAAVLLAVTLVLLWTMEHSG